MPGNVLTRSTRPAIEFAPAALVVAAQERVERSEQNTVRIKSRISPVRLSQTADKKPRADQRHHREGHLSDHECVSQGNLARSASDSGRIVFHGCDQILLGG